MQDFSILTEIVALEIGVSELILSPSYPDDERRCSDIVKSWMARTSPTVEHRGAEAARQKVMVTEWRHAARRVLSELQRRGVMV